MQFFIDEKLPDVNMMALKSMGWDFIVKGIEFLDTQLGLEYISTPLSLLWKIIREALPCSAYAVKFMTSRLLKVQSQLTGPNSGKCALFRAPTIRGICYRCYRRDWKSVSQGGFCSLQSRSLQFQSYV